MPGLAPILPVDRRGLALRLVLAALGRAPGARAAGAAVAVFVAVLGGVERVQPVQVHVRVDEIIERGVIAAAAVRSAAVGRSGDLALDGSRRGQRRAELREAEGDVALRAAVACPPGRQAERRRRRRVRVGGGRRRRGGRYRGGRGAQIGVGRQRRRQRERVEREEERLGERARVVGAGAAWRRDLAVGRREARRLRVRRRPERRREAAVPGRRGGCGGGGQVERRRGARHWRLPPELLLLLRREVVARGTGGVGGGARVVHPAATPS